MPIIPLMAYNVFTVMDETYWTGYPSAETDPYTDPVPNWGNSALHDGQAQAGEVSRCSGMHEHASCGRGPCPPKAWDGQVLAMAIDARFAAASPACGERATAQRAR